MCEFQILLSASFRSVRAKLKNLTSITTAWRSGRVWLYILTSSKTVVISLLKSLTACFPGKILIPLKRQRMKWKRVRKRQKEKLRGKAQSPALKQSHPRERARALQAGSREAML
jgi:hypothetical protein